MEDDKFEPRNINKLNKRNCKPNFHDDDQADIGAELENMFVRCATIPGTAAWRISEMGAVFVQAIALFARVLTKIFWRKSTKRFNNA